MTGFRAFWCIRLCYDVSMCDTVLISMRIDKDVLTNVEAEAKRMRWSRNATLQTCIEFGLPDLRQERGPRTTAATPPPPPKAAAKPEAPKVEPQPAAKAQPAGDGCPHGYGSRKF